MKKLAGEFNIVAQDDTFVIELESYPSTGFGWELEVKEGNALMLRQEYISEEPKTDDPLDIPIGGPVNEVFTYSATQTGTVKIQAQYKRAWETDIPPAQVQNFTIDVLPVQKLTAEFSAAVVRNGETFSIELKEMPSTGYTWQLRVEEGKAAFVERDFPLEPGNDPGERRYGGVINKAFFVEAEQVGTLKIVADCKRRWEKNVPPRKSHTFTVTVQ